SVFAMARADLSWRPWTRKMNIPREIETIDRLAQAFEAYNLTASHLRDRFLLLDPDATLRATMARLDREVSVQHRRMTAVGGSDSHEMHLRATSFVLAETRTEAGIRDVIVAGRTCVRDPAACSLVAHTSDRVEIAIGDAIDGVDALEVSA